MFSTRPGSFPKNINVARIKSKKILVQLESTASQILVITNGDLTVLLNQLCNNWIFKKNLFWDIFQLVYNYLGGGGGNPGIFSLAAKGS